ncbi:MAG: GGDEF domain-containing protein [Solirubrobacteraceae bacterium]|nr:GGDEF domain-containing protein [Solirubrobacteraceae bacterium]
MGEPRTDNIERLRKTIAALSGVGVLAILFAVLIRDRDPSDHAAMYTLAGCFGVTGVTMGVWRNAPEGVVVGVMMLAIGFISVAVGVTRPMLLTPSFYLWPIMITAYYLTRRHVIVNSVWAIVTFALALFFVAEPTDRMIIFCIGCSIILATATVVTSLRAQNDRLVDQLQTLARHDALTGVLNRGAFEDQMAKLAGRDYAIVALDIDHFKQVNDEFGHAEGDTALQRLALIAHGSARPDDVFARVGGEEFALLLRNTGLEEATAIAERLRSRVEDETRGDDVPMTISIGVAATDRGDHADIMLAADRALYGAKRTGRNRVVANAATVAAA